MSFMKIHPALATTLHRAIHGKDATPDCAADMSPEDWDGLVKGFLKFISEEEREPEHAEDARDTSGALTEAERAEAGRNHESREEMPANAFLDPSERKYPVRERRDGEWKYSRNLLLAAAREARMHGHEELADRADKIRGGMAHDGDVFALDKDVENRTKTVDGRLLVKSSIFSAANVCDYVGNEIPDWESLGLDPKKVYKIYRDPTELRKAAPTFDKIPVLLQHIPSTADNHPTDEVVGTTGEKTRLNGDKLEGSLAIWDARGIDAIESGRQKSLSCGYRYTAVKKPGTAPDGTPFDLRMADITGNHITLVTEPRVESAVVGDENPFKTAGLSGDTVKEPNMTVKNTRLSPMAAAAKGAIVAHIRPQLATDAKVDFGALVKGVTKKGWAADRARILKALPAAIKGKGPKLATDAEVGPIVAQVEKLLDTINPAEEGMDDDPDAGGMDGEEKKPDWSAEDQKAYDEMCEKRSKAGAMDEEDETEEERKARMEKRAADKAAKDAELEAGKTALDTEEEKPVTKAAMDARLAKMAKDSAAEISRVRQATIQQMRDTAEALNQVKPLVGEIAIACDTALDVYTHTMKQLGIASDGLPAAAMKVIIERELAHKGDDRAITASLALDSSQVTELESWKAANGISVRRTAGA